MAHFVQFGEPVRTYSDVIAARLERLNGEVKDFGFHLRIDPEHLIEADVQIHLFDATVKSLRELSAQKADLNGREGLNKSLDKVGKKIAFAKNVLTFLSSNSENVDPRIQHTVAKVQKMMLSVPKTGGEQLDRLKEKYAHYQRILEDLSYGRTNPQTEKSIQNAKQLLAQLQLQILAIEPGREVIRPWGKQNYEARYEGLNNVPECMALVEPAMATYYLTAISNDGLRRVYIDDVADRGHALTADFIKGHSKDMNPPAAISIRDLINEDKWGRLAEVPCEGKFEYIKDQGICFAPNQNPKEILGQLQILKQLKEHNKLPKIGAVLSIGQHQLPIFFHSDGHFSVLLPRGDEGSEGHPVQLSFGTEEQLSGCMHKFLSDAIKGNGGLSGQQARLTPVCLREDLERKEMRKGFDLDFLHFDDEQLYHQPLNFTDVRFDFEEPEPASLERACPPAIPLQKVIAGLEKMDDEGFYQAIEAFSALQEFKMPFIMSGDTDEQTRQIADRIFFHLYFIQNNETPDKINRKDPNWGSNAFQIEGLATPEQKLRAAQRAQVEVLLFALNLAIEHRDEEQLPLLFKALEEMKLDPRDLPSGQKNLAHALFGKLYENYLKAWESDKSMVHPHDGKFKGDFGRHGFCSTGEVKISPEIRMQTLKELSDQLKATWKI
ncbi:MAG: hypothetical protein JSS60_05005 [Verrucomicrobia bacterium]|nr:hypothetical protein [Verrucomicrobiota bacterium]